MENRPAKDLIKNHRLYNSPYAMPMILICIAMNFGFSKLAAHFGLPIYLDNIGTICSAVMGGYIPGIVTAVFTNMVNYFVDEVSVYYAAISALIAITTTIFSRKGRLSKPGWVIGLILIIALIGGGAGSVITWYLSGAATEGFYADAIEWYSGISGMGVFVSHVVVTFFMDIVDKAITVIISLTIIHFVPEKAKKKLWLTSWRQTPMSDEDIISVSHKVRGNRSLSVKLTLVLIISSALMASGIIFVSTTIFSEYSHNQHTKQAEGIANLIADEIDPGMVNTYLEKGESVKGYKETEELLYDIRNSTPDIEYVYVYKIMEDGCHVVFDLDTDELEGEEPGTVIPFDKSFEPLVPDLLAGHEIEPIETNDTYGWLFTVYKPVYDKEGICVCYAACDIAISDMQHYINDFIIKIILLFLGFFMLIIFVAVWLTQYHILMPINSMAAAADSFAFSENLADDDTEAEENLKRILDIKIETDDELQNLYESFCKMTGDTVEHMKSIREQSEAIDDLQRGLIMAMADMVEGRDSDTGNHIRKTAAYARIIMDGLRSKGYYTDQLTDQFIYDVERSAPLHDIGKISVSDVILNKPGKLTDEEFEIMKTHTTAGKEMIDQVIESVNGESYLKEARNLAGYHHEKWNGKGYPEGLSGEDIPLSARIMAIADVFDALSSKRCYKPSMSFEKAVSIIQEDSGTHFDPKCVEAFTDNLDKIKEVLEYYNELEAEGAKVRGNEKTVD